MTNKEIAQQFSLLAKLMDIHNENSFKIKSYTNASFAIDKLTDPLSETEPNEIKYLKGIGESTAQKIIDILHTGKMNALEELIQKTPKGILQLLQIKGIGPKKIATIWHELGIESPGELLYACNENRLIDYKGFGEKTQQNIKENLEFYFSNQSSFLYAQMKPLASHISTFLEKIFGKETVTIVGKFAQQYDTLDELEFLIVQDEEEISSALANENEITFKENKEGILIFEYKKILPIYIHTATENNVGSQTLIHTSSTDFLQTFEDTFGFDFSQEEFSKEEEIFEEAAIQFIPFYARNNSLNILLHHEINYDHIISTKDIKGVIHNHSIWSDGKYSIAQMANACIEKGFEYLVMSDHSVTSFYANGLSVERIQKQQEEIDELNKKLAPFKIFKSIECDILNDGRLDYDNTILSTFDLVICSIHQNLKMTEEKAMQRLLAAISNPYTTILGHCTGRLLLSRKEYPINHLEIIAACKKHHVAIEINANPRRLDIDWTWIQDAMKEGVLLSINPDAHSLEGIDDIEYGVISAQKGLLTATHNLSSMSLLEFEIFLAKNKKKQT